MQKWKGRFGRREWKRLESCIREYVQKPHIWKERRLNPPTASELAETVIRGFIHWYVHYKIKIIE